VVTVKLAVTLLILPFKILGFVLRLVFGIVGAVVGLLFSGLGLGLAVLAVVAVAILAPLLPILLVGMGIWLVVRAARPRPAVQVIRA
jgi:hypothetical protein